MKASIQAQHPWQLKKTFSSGHITPPCNRSWAHFIALESVAVNIVSNIVCFPVQQDINCSLVPISTLVRQRANGVYWFAKTRLEKANCAETH